MKALETRILFSGFGTNREKRLEDHHHRLKAMKNVVDTSAPQTLNARCTSPSKKIIAKQAARERVIKENLNLAQRIFNIMEGNSDITEQINDTRHIDGHPGTMNFKLRLLEAQRIHERNMMLASRLDTIQPYYKVSDLTIARPIKKKVQVKKSNKKSKFAQELKLVLKGAQRVRDGDMTHRSTGHDAPTVGVLKFSKLNVGDPSTQSQSARKANYGPPKSMGSSVDSEPRSDSPRNRPSNVLLEYTKIQDGHVLDVAVLKEPFRDRYAIFGIDVDDGQRFELRLTSDEVSSILDGDMLVTSVDNVEVWMALLNKVVLQRVDCFARLPFTSDEVDTYNNSHNNSTSAVGSPTAKSSRPAQNAFNKKEDRGEGEVSDSEELGDVVPYHYTLTSSQKSVSPPLSPKLTERGGGGKDEGGKPQQVTDAPRVPSAPAAARPSHDRPSSRVGSAGTRGVTSAAGAVRNRHLRSGGGGGKGGSSGGGAQAASASDRLASTADPILSLFAETGIDVEANRTELVTPGFLANATSAPVQLVERNDDFPDAPIEPASPVVEDQQAPTIPLESSTVVSKKVEPTKPTGQKSNSTRATALRAAAVQRKSVLVDSSEHAKHGGGSKVHHGAGMDAEERAAARAELNKKRLSKLEVAKPGGVATTKEVPAKIMEVQEVTGSSAPKPPSVKAQEGPDGAVRPKSRLYTPKEPAKTTTATVTTEEAPLPKSTSSAAAQPKSSARDVTSLPSTSTSTSIEATKEAARPKSNARPKFKPSAEASTASSTGPAPAPGLIPSAPAPSTMESVVRPKSTARRDITSSNSSNAGEEKEKKASAVEERPKSSATGALSPKAPLSSPAGSATRPKPSAAAPPSARKSSPGESAPTSAKPSEQSAAAADGPVDAFIGQPGPNSDASPRQEAAGGSENVDASRSVESQGEGSSQQMKSAQASTAETPLEYSMDFEHSSAHAEVFQVHE